MKNILIAIESSCDDTALTLIDFDGNIIAEKKATQIIHNQYGGVYPELASREHLNAIQVLWKEVYTDDIKQNYQISHIAVTQGPGLIGSLLVGVMFAKGLAVALDAKLIGINHLEGHLFSCEINEKVEFPCLFNLFSGGHTMIVYAKSWFDYEVLSQTIDDSIGEAYDKVAKMLNLGYPGGPVVEKMARNGDKNAFKFKIPMQGEVNFSMSGLKTNVLRLVESFEYVKENNVFDICASFQKCVIDTIFSKIQMCKKSYKSIALVGGVSANLKIRAAFEDFASKNAVKFICPDLKYTTDNSTMIAFCALEKLKNNHELSSLDFSPKSRWMIGV